MLTKKIFIILTILFFGQLHATNDLQSSQSWLDWFFSWTNTITEPLVEPLAKGVATLIEQVGESDVNKHDISKATEHLKKEVGQYNEFIDNLSSLMKNVSKQFNIDLTPAQWLEYAEKTFTHNDAKDKNHINVMEIIDKGHQRLINSGTNKELDLLDQQQGISFINTIQQYHHKAVDQLNQGWTSHQDRYQLLQKKLGANSNWFKKTLHYVGYGAVFIGGPYLGNVLYKKYMASFFTATNNNQQALMTHIRQIQQHCEQSYIALESAQTEEKKADISDERRDELKKFIKNLSQSIQSMEAEIKTLSLKMRTPQKTSNWRTYAGLAVRIGSMAAMTYIFYALFKKIDEKYLTTGLNDGPLTPEERILLMKELDLFTLEKVALDKQILITKQLTATAQTIKNAGDDQSLLHAVLNLKRMLEQYPLYQKSLKEMQEQFNNLQMDGLRIIMPNGSL